MEPCRLNSKRDISSTSPKGPWYLTILTATSLLTFEETLTSLAKKQADVCRKERHPSSEAGGHGVAKKHMHLLDLRILSLRHRCRLLGDAFLKNGRAVVRTMRQPLFVAKLFLRQPTSVILGHHMPTILTVRIRVGALAHCTKRPEANLIEQCV